MKRSLHALAAAALVGVLLAASACGDGSRSGTAAGPPPRSKQISVMDFNPASFDRSTVIDNAWLPLRPGTTLVLEGSSVEEGKRVSHRVVSTVTDLVKPIAGVRAVVVWERDWSDGALTEAELALFAQDDDGNVWHLGEYPEEYENGKVVDAPAWFHGIRGARAGIAMKAHPRLGEPDYAQGFAPPPINWVDRGQTYKVNQLTCVPTGCYDGVLVVREFERGKPDAAQLKYYARGLGTVRVGWRGAKDEAREVLVLTRVRHLDARAMAGVRRAALKLERHAYETSKAVYGRTAPSRREQWSRR